MIPNGGMFWLQSSLVLTTSCQILLSNYLPIDSFLEYSVSSFQFLLRNQKSFTYFFSSNRYGNVVILEKIPQKNLRLLFSGLLLFLDLL